MAAGAAVNLAGGSHHAQAAYGAGFCVFNDVAVAAETMLGSAGVNRILVIDLDVHQGDGTARIFAGREDVFTLSVHCADNWPTEKPPSDLDVALPQGTPDAIYLPTLRQVLEQAFTLAEPDFVFYNAGVDPHIDDRLGKLALSDGGLLARDTMVAETCMARQVPVCGVLGGGYAKDPMQVAKRHLLLVEALNKIVVSDN
jgi:acetoin utilization deacetylase AcuC-like enzyme